MEELELMIEETNQQFDEMQSNRDNIMSGIHDRHVELQDAINNMNKSVYSFKAGQELNSNGPDPVCESLIDEIDSIGKELDVLLASL